MKIYEIGTGYTPVPARMGAATEIVVEELTRALLKKGEDVTIIDIKAADRPKTTLPITEVSVPSAFTGTDVRLGIMHKLKRVVYSVSLALALKKLLGKSGEKTVLHFHNQYNMFFFLKLVPARLRKNCFTAYTNHSYIWHGDWSEIRKTVKKRYFQEVACMKKADMVYVLNEHTADTLTGHIGIDPQKLRLMDNGVNTEVYRPLSREEIAGIKSGLGLSGKRVYLQIGSVCDRKNQLGALELLLPLLREDANAVFAYAGGIISDEYQLSVTQAARKHGVEDRVIYLGELEPGSELNRYYNLADVMVFPSRSEGFSLVIVESMAAGVPVVIDESLQFGLAAECLRYKSSGQFCDIIRSSIIDTHARAELAARVRAAVTDSYSWDKVASDYLESWAAE